MALLVLTILVIVVGQMVLSNQHNRAVADNAMADLLNSYGVKAGYYQGRLYLEADADRGAELDSVNERWTQEISFQLGQAKVTVKIVDTSSKLNLTQVVNEQGAENAPVLDQLRRLLLNFGHSDEAAYRILDYQDKDTKGDFELGARNERFTTLDELLRVEGIPRAVFYGDESHQGILPLLTVWPRSGSDQGASQININTAPAEVLQTLDDDLTPSLAAMIVAYRQQRSEEGDFQHFKNVGDLANVPGMTQKLLQAITPHCTVKASTFEIHAKSEVANVTKRWIYVVDRAAQVKTEGQNVPTLITLRTQLRELEVVSVEAPKEEK